MRYTFQFTPEDTLELIDERGCTYWEHNPGVYHEPEDIPDIELPVESFTYRYHWHKLKRWFVGCGFMREHDELIYGGQGVA